MKFIEFIEIYLFVFTKLIFLRHVKNKNFLNKKKFPHFTTAYLPSDDLMVMVLLTINVI